MTLRSPACSSGACGALDSTLHEHAHHLTSPLGILVEIGQRLAFAVRAFGYRDGEILRRRPRFHGARRTQSPRASAERRDDDLEARDDVDLRVGESAALDKALADQSR